MNRFFVAIAVRRFRIRSIPLLAEASVACASVLLIAASILLIDSYFAKDAFFLNHPWRWHTVRISMVSFKGQMRIQVHLPLYPFPWQREGSEEADLRQFIEWEHDRGFILRFPRNHPFWQEWETRWKYERFRFYPFSFRILFDVPHLVVMATLGGYIILFLIWRTAARRLAAGFGKGHCERCGYDLRATPTRCPECGAATLQGVKIE